MQVKSSRLLVVKYEFILNFSERPQGIVRVSCPTGTTPGGHGHVL